MPRGPRSRAIDSDRMRWAALVGAKPAKFALPRIAEVLPVTRIAPLPRLIMSGATSRAKYNKPITLTRKLCSSILGSISRNVPHPPPTALWIRTSGAPYDLRMLATVSLTWLSLETSQIIAWVSGSSCSSARIRSGERASAITRNPPAAKRRTIEDPVPGPTPVTMAIGFSVTDAASPWLFASPMLNDYHHITQLRFGAFQGAIDAKVSPVTPANGEIPVRALR